MSVLQSVKYIGLGLILFLSSGITPISAWACRQYIQFSIFAENHGGRFQDSLTRASMVQKILKSLDSHPYRTGLLVEYDGKKYLGTGSVVDGHQIILNKINEQIGAGDLSTVTVLWAGELYGTSKDGFLIANTTAGLLKRNENHKKTASVKKLKDFVDSQPELNSLFRSGEDYWDYETRPDHLHQAMEDISDFRHDFQEEMRNVLSGLSLLTSIPLTSTEYHGIYPKLLAAFKKSQRTFRAFIELKVPFEESERLVELTKDLVLLVEDLKIGEKLRFENQGEYEKLIASVKKRAETPTAFLQVLAF